MSDLHDQGYKEIGSGADAQVWAKRSGDVIKIIMGSRGSPAADTFKQFVQFSKRNQDIPHLPKFTDLKVRGTGYTAVAMERLYPLRTDSFEEAMVWIFSDLVTKKLPWSEAVKHIQNADTWRYWEGTNTAQDIISHFNGLSDLNKKKLQLLYQLMVLLYHKGIVNKLGWDLHTENVMRRKNGTLVIIDPWYANSGMV